MIEEAIERIERHMEKIRSSYAELDINSAESCYDTLLEIQKYKNRIAHKLKQIEDELVSRVGGKYYVGQRLVAKADCMNNFTKGQVVEVTEIGEDLVVLDGVAGISIKSADKWFEDKTRV